MNGILFLDVDGVLNSHATKMGSDGVRDCVLQRPYSSAMFTGCVEEAKVAALVDMVEACNAKIVVSSSWREAFADAAQFASAIGLPPLAGAVDLFHRDWRTEQKFSASRAQEISIWLSGHRRSVKRYAILDDHDVCIREPELSPHMVQTDPEVGLTAADLDRVRALL